MDVPNIVLVTGVSGNLGPGLSCPFSFCPRFGANMGSVSALRAHISVHLRRSRVECLSGRGVRELVQHLHVHGRWLCGRCCKTYMVGSRCRNRGCGVNAPVSEGSPIFMPPGFEMPALREESAIQQDRTALVVYNGFKPFDEDPEVFKKLRCSAIPTMNFIPKACRRGVAKCYGETVKAVNEVPSDLNRWGIMQIFIVTILRSVGKEERGGVPLSAMVTQRLRIWEEGGGGQRRLWEEAVGNRACREPTLIFSVEDQRKINVKRCKKLVTLGRLGDAASALNSKGIMSQSQEVVDELTRKHPFAPHLELPPGQPPSSLVPSWEEVWRAMQAFPRGSAGGRDGLKPQLLVDMVQGVAGRVEEDLVQTIFTGHVRLLLSGGAPPSLAPMLMSAPIIPLAKSGGGVRPIAIGEVWRRLTSKVALSAVSASAKAFLLPFQLGVGVKGAAEAITHSLNHLVTKHSNDEGMGILKVDLTNAFNLVSRKAFVEGVRQYFPSLSSWVEYCYGCHASLFIGETIIISSRGVQQGDPLGPLLFAIALQPLLRQIGELCPNLLFNAWYLDDGVLMGRQTDLLASLDVIRRVGPQLGLVVNLSKSLWWWPEGGMDRPIGLPVEVVVSDSSALSVLGNPISVDGRGADEIVGQRVKIIKDILAEMSKLDDPQLELLLLRACVGMPKMMYNLRSAPPSWIEGSIQGFDSAVHQSLVHIYNCGFTIEKRRLIGLPLKFGGLGVPIGSEVALSAAVASLVQAGGLWEMLTKDPFSSSMCGILLEEWNLRFRQTSPVVMEELRSKAKPQQWLSGLAAEVIRDEIKSCGGARVTTLVNAVSVSGSGIWTTAIPTPFYGLHMNPVAYRLALKYRTGQNVFSISRACSSCRGLQTSDAAGDHDSHCPGGGRRIRRHNAVRDALFIFFREANMGPRLEVAGLLDGGEKPADILVPGWDGGRDLCVDVSIVSPFVGEGTELESGEAARRAEERKILRYESGCSANGLIFEPFIMESLGGFGGRAERLIRTLAARWAEAKGMEPPSALSILRQKLSFVSQKALADGFLLRIG